MWKVSPMMPCALDQNGLRNPDGVSSWSITMVTIELAGTLKVVVGRKPTQVGCGSFGRGFSIAVPTAPTVSRWITVSVWPGWATLGADATTELIAAGVCKTKPTMNAATRADRSPTNSTRTTSRITRLVDRTTPTIKRTLAAYRLLVNPRNLFEET